MITPIQLIERTKFFKNTLATIWLTNVREPISILDGQKAPFRNPLVAPTLIGMKLELNSLGVMLKVGKKSGIKNDVILDTDDTTFRIIKVQKRFKDNKRVITYTMIGIQSRYVYEVNVPVSHVSKNTITLTIVEEEYKEFRSSLFSEGYRLYYHYKTEIEFYSYFRWSSVYKKFLKKHFVDGSERVSVAPYALDWYNKTY
jgi:hypothetical protein